MMNLKFMKTTFLRAFVCALLTCELTVFSGETAGGVTSQTGRTGQTSRTDPCKPQTADINSIENEIQNSKFKTQNLPGSSSSISSTEENTAAGTSALHVMDESHGSGRGGLPHDRSFQHSAYNVQTANSVTDATPCVSTHSTPSASHSTPSPSGSSLSTTNYQLSTNGFSLCDNPFRYSGYYTDTESGMNYLKARYYSPKYNVFTSRDTYDLDNRFAYCGGNPVMKTDPNGHFPWEITKTIGKWAPAGVMALFGVGCIALAATSTTDQTPSPFRKTNTDNSQNWLYALGGLFLGAGALYAGREFYTKKWGLGLNIPIVGAGVGLAATGIAVAATVPEENNDRNTTTYNTSWGSAKHMITIGGFLLAVAGLAVGGRAGIAMIRKEAAEAEAARAAAAGGARAGSDSRDSVVNYVENPLLSMRRSGWPL